MGNTQRSTPVVEIHGQQESTRDRRPRRRRMRGETFFAVVYTTLVVAVVVAGSLFIAGGIG